MSMYRSFLKHFLLKTTLLISTTSILLVLSLVEVQAAKPPPVPFSCSILPVDGSTAEGVPISFSGMTQGGKGSIEGKI